MQYLIKIKLYFIIIFLTGIQLSVSQSIVSNNFSVSDGLPSNAVYSVLKDSRGILWVGTDKGISKIENTNISNFYEKDGLAYNNCWDIIEDENKNLWFGSYGGGITYYNGQVFTVINTEQGLVNNYIRKLYLNENYIYVGTQAGVSVINTINKKVITLKCETELQVMGFFQFNNVIYIQSYRNGVWKHDAEKSTLIKIAKKPTFVFSVFKNNDSILVSLDGFSHKNKSIKKYHITDYLNGQNPHKEFGNSVYWDFIKDKRNIVYGVAYGVNFPTGGAFEIKNTSVLNTKKAFKINSAKNWSIDYDSINDQLYIGTLDKGLFKLNLDNKITFNDSFKNILAIEQLRGTHYFLTKNSLKIKIKDSTTTITKHTFFNEFNDYFKYKTKQDVPRGHSSHFISNEFDKLAFLSLKKFKEAIWINTTIGLYKLNTKSHELSYFPCLTREFILFKDDSGYFQKPYSYVFYLDNVEKPNRFVRFQKEKLNIPQDVTSIKKIGDKLFFLSRYHGLYKLENKNFISYLETNLWTEKELMLACVNNKNQLIVSTSRGDVFVLDVNKSFKVVATIKNEEIHGKSISILKSYKDYIIIGTEKGLTFYRNGKRILIDEEQGVIDEIITSAIIDDDVLIVGTKNGYYNIDLIKVLYSKPQNYRINILNIQVNYKDVDTKAYIWFKYNKNNISLPYNENNISISFDIENHPYPQKLEYQYKIDDLNENNWSHWSSNTQINFPQLSAGVYPIVIKIRDLSNGEYYTQSLFTIEITPPFWRTLWFWLIVTVLISSLVFFTYKYKISKIKAQEALKSDLNKRIAETKLEALQSQMNPHFTFNAMSSIQNYVIDNDIDKALMYIGEFSKLMRKTLDNSSETYINLQEEIDYLNTYITLENMRFDNAVDVTINHEGLSTVDELIPPMLIQPLIENSFNHAFNLVDNSHKLTITFSKENNVLKCVVADNGGGIKKPVKIPQHTSKAMRIIKERLSLISHSLFDELVNIDSSDKGTITTIYIPLPS